MDVFMLFVINVLGCKRHLFDVKTMCVCVCVRVCVYVFVCVCWS
jgi:hypothetical protein